MGNEFPADRSTEPTKGGCDRQLMILGAVLALPVWLLRIAWRRRK